MISQRGAVWLVLLAALGLFWTGVAWVGGLALAALMEMVAS